MHDPTEYSSYEGVVESEGPGVWFDPEIGEDEFWRERWRRADNVELHVTQNKIYIFRRGEE